MSLLLSMLKLFLQELLRGGYVLKATPKYTKRAIRQLLLEYRSATKVELNEKLDSCFPTISKFLAQMEKDGEISLVGLDESSGVHVQS